jgi:FixJ family two-component response regulator
MTATSPLLEDPRTAQATVVVIDDDQALLSALRFDFELQGFLVQTYQAARDISWDALPKGNGCLVIDYRLPGINGLELLRRLRERHVDLPALVITSQPSTDLRAQIAGLGARLIEKPLLGDQLISGIRAALSGAQVSPPQ